MSLTIPCGNCAARVPVELGQKIGTCHNCNWKFSGGTINPDWDPPKDPMPDWTLDKTVREAEAAGTVGNFEALAKLCIDPETDTLFYVVSEGNSVFSFSEGDISKHVMFVENVKKMLKANGCDCGCDHYHDWHEPDCERCLACRIELAMKGL